MNILAWRAIGNALDVDVLKMAPEYKNFDNPFWHYKMIRHSYQRFQKESSHRSYL